MAFFDFPIRKELSDESFIDRLAESAISQIGFVFDRLEHGPGGGFGGVGLDGLGGDRKVPREDQQRRLQLDRGSQGESIATGV